MWFEIQLLNRKRISRWTAPLLENEMLSSTSDPYYVARDEVQTSLRKLVEQQTEWRALLQRENTAKSKRFKDLHTDIAAELKEIESDLKDIEDTIKMVEDNRARFSIDDAEVNSRRDFVKHGRMKVKEGQDEMQRAQSKIESDKREYLRLQEQQQASHVTHENEKFLRGHKQEQEQIMAQQDEHLGELSKAAERLGNTAVVINQELQEHNKLLQELDEDIDRETEKLNFVMKRIGKLMKTSDRKELCLILALSALFVFLLFLVINT